MSKFETAPRAGTTPDEWDSQDWVFPELEAKVGLPVIVVSQGGRVPRDAAEVANPQLIEDRIRAEKFTDDMATLDVKYGQDALDGVDELLRRALGIKALPDDVVAELQK
mgnify:CR=1 FL=1